MQTDVERGREKKLIRDEGSVLGISRGIMDEVTDEVLTIHVNSSPGQQVFHGGVPHVSAVILTPHSLSLSLLKT